jgi:hypothetical protein
MEVIFVRGPVNMAYNIIDSFELHLGRKHVVAEKFDLFS